MIIVDTNVISEPMRPDPDPSVIAWLDRQNAETLFTTTVNLAELLSGVDLLPEGRRKTLLTSKLEDLLGILFEDRILPFDRAAANAYAKVVTEARSNGFTISVADAQIAAITRSKNMTIATRDVSPFEAAGLKVIDPWSRPSA